ncbi:MAG: hypothetical protein R2864_12695 [Syntrophotaleaceae bacterium]
MVTDLKGLPGRIIGIFGTDDAATSANAMALSKEEILTSIISEQLRVRPLRGAVSLTSAICRRIPNWALIANTTAKAYIEETLEMKLSATRRA